MFGYVFFETRNQPRRTYKDFSKTTSHYLQFLLINGTENGNYLFLKNYTQMVLNIFY
jgi:hypothetical protein